MFLLPVEWGRTRRFWGGKGFKSPYTSISLPLCNGSLICTSNLAGAHLRRESGQMECPRWSGVHHCCWTHPCSLPDPFSIPLPTSFFPPCCRNVFLHSIFSSCWVPWFCRLSLQMCGLCWFFIHLWHPILFVSLDCSHNYSPAHPCKKQRLALPEYGREEKHLCVLEFQLFA